MQLFQVLLQIIVLECSGDLHNTQQSVKWVKLWDIKTESSFNVVDHTKTECRTKTSLPESQQNYHHKIHQSGISYRTIVFNWITLNRFIHCTHPSTHKYI